MAWQRLFQIQEVIYKELEIKILATVPFRRKIGYVRGMESYVLSWGEGES